MPPPIRLGKYEIRRELGKGSMGVVYEGFDPLIQRSVAIKVMRDDELDPSQADELLARLRREAQAAGRLNHPGIVAIYDYGEEASFGGTQVAFIAMELVHGRDLKTVLEGGHAVSIGDVMRWMQAILTALEHAHRHGVIHRDMKPANVILLNDGRLKIADFGVARLESSEMTRVGTVLGTPAYMAPEQLMGMAVDGRADLFSCGVILYQLLTGSKPFTGGYATIVHKVLHEDPVPPTQLNQALSPAWDAVVRRAMAKQPAERFQTAAEFAAAVNEAAIGDNEPTVLMPRPSAGASAGTMAGSLSGQSQAGTQRGATVAGLPQAQAGTDGSALRARQEAGTVGVAAVGTQAGIGAEGSRGGTGPTGTAPADRDASAIRGSTTGTRTGLKDAASTVPPPGSTPAGGAPRKLLLGALGVGAVAIAAVAAFVLRPGSAPKPAADPAASAASAVASAAVPGAFTGAPATPQTVPGSTSAASPSTSLPATGGPANLPTGSPAPTQVATAVPASRPMPAPTAPVASKPAPAPASTPAAVQPTTPKPDVQPSGSQAPELTPFAHEWRTQRGSLASVPGRINLTMALNTLLGIYRDADRQRVADLESVLRQSPPHTVLAMGVANGIIVFAPRTHQVQSQAIDLAVARCQELRATGCAAVFVDGEFRRPAFNEAMSWLGSRSVADVRTSFLRILERAPALARPIPAVVPSMPAAQPRTAVPPPGGVTGAETLPANPGNPINPARPAAAPREWPDAVAALRAAQGTLKLDRALSLLLGLRLDDDLDRVAKFTRAMRQAPWKSALALGERNGDLVWGWALREGQAQWAEDTALSNCGKAGGSHCVVVMTNGDFNESAFLSIAARMGAMRQQAVQESVMRRLPRTIG